MPVPYPTIAVITRRSHLPCLILPPNQSVILESIRIKETPFPPSGPIVSPRIIHLHNHPIPSPNLLTIKPPYTPYRDGNDHLSHSKPNRHIPQPMSRRQSSAATRRNRNNQNPGKQGLPTRYPGHHVVFVSGGHSLVVGRRCRAKPDQGTRDEVEDVCPRGEKTEGEAEGWKIRIGDSEAVDARVGMKTKGENADEGEEGAGSDGGRGNLVVDLLWDRRQDGEV